MARSRYWDIQFRKFEKNRGGFVPTFSWWALIFSVLWYAHKKMWPKALMLLWAVSFLGGLLPEDGRMSALLLWFLYPALFGKWDYYLLKKRGTYFW